MLTFEDTITIYNSLYNPSTGYDEYYRTVVTGCSWYGQNKANVSSDGLLYHKKFEVRILDGWSESEKYFVPPKKYEDPNAQYTLSPGTIIVKGIGPAAPTNGAELAALIENSDAAFKVLDWRDNRRVGIKHLYAEGQ